MRRSLIAAPPTAATADRGSQIGLRFALCRSIPPISIIRSAQSSSTHAPPREAGSTAKRLAIVGPQVPPRIDERNKTKGEVKASQDGIDNGIKRGNPAPKFAASLREAGSGGLFGALSPFVAWTGMDEDYMPYLEVDWTIIENPIVATICAAKYYQRIVGGGRYPVHANPAQPSPEDNYRVRLGWASPKALKEDPGGTLFQSVKKRFDEDLAQLGLKISDLSPPNADRWPGLKAVVAAMQGFPVTWK